MNRLSEFVRFKKAMHFFVFFIAIVVANFHQVHAEVEYETLEWDDLLPPLDLSALQSRTMDHDQVLDSPSEPTWESDGDIIGDEINGWGNPQNNFEEDAYQSALMSTNTVDSLDGKNISIPGFIVPLEFDESLTVTQFFLVPYFGACMHFPAPPPNQMVLVNYPEGIQMDPFYTPFVISGKMSIQIVENELGVSAYTLEMDSMQDYYYQ